ncbi:hypothetical protein ALC62_14132 [Cyphomyrmex costatus]|uniref:Uncharacterized protein n=1 Tax=Cyphomyrmex costatus TaxID=456900 RepID=A0A195C4W8_9HYME|nr:hypothetical protein ALC62_14132 [Cyphomyrmex costatus]
MLHLIINIKCDYLFALRKIVQRLIAKWYFVNAELLSQQQCMSHSLYFLQPRQLLEFPLMIEYETISTRSPSVKILFAPNVCGARVQDATLTSLNSYKYIWRENGWKGRITKNRKKNQKNVFPQIIKIFTTYLKIRGDSHKDLFSVGCDSIEQSRVVQRAVPSCFESEHSPIVSRNFEILAREQAQ